MKKICAFIVCIAMIIPFFVSSASAVQADNTELNNNVVYYTCDYDASSKQVIIEGTVNHDFMVSHSDYIIKVVSVLPGEDFDNINIYDRSVLAEAFMSVKFTFFIKADSNAERYSKYAVIFFSPDGEDLIVGEPKIPSVSSAFSYDSDKRIGFKGILADNMSLISDSGAGTVIIDVDFGKMLGETSDSILYPMNDSYIHIKKSYISELDKKAVSAAVGGGRVYFRLLLNADETFIEPFSYSKEKKYSIPNVYSETVIDYIYALTSFLAERYCDKYNGIYGIIAGTCIDETENVNSIGDIDAEEYAELYTLYITVLANAVRRNDNTADVVIPLSSANDYTSNLSTAVRIRPSVLLEKIIYRLDNTVSGDFDCSAMIESETTPLGITPNNIGDGINLGYKENTASLGASNISDFTDYLEVLSKRYDNVPSNIIYLWHSAPSLVGDALCCSYAYNYYTLAKNSAVSSFVADFGENTASAEGLLKYIDTDKSNEYLSKLLRYFKDMSWVDDKPAVKRVLIEKELFSSKPNGMSGFFNYMDFTSSSVFECMNVGANCDYIRSDYDSYGTRALHVGINPLELGETAECIGFFKYGEDYSYTDFLSLKFKVSDVTADEGALYEVSLTVGMDNSRIVASGYVQNGAVSELFFDVSDFSAISYGDCIKISVRCLSGESEALSLWLYELNGYSDEYTSEELVKLIEASRRNIRGEKENDDGSFDYTLIITVAGIMFAIGAVAVGLFMVFRRENDYEKNKD